MGGYRNKIERYVQIFLVYIRECKGG